jgi:hypothetical protein
MAGLAAELEGEEEDEGGASWRSLAAVIGKVSQWVAMDR